MSMNTPQQPQPQDNTPMEATPAPQPEVAPATPVEQPEVAQTEQTAPTEQTTPVDTAPEGQPTEAQEQQVIEGVAQGLADDEITAEDIMTAVLSDSLGLSPNGARSLFQLLMQDLADDAQAEAGMTKPPMEQ